MWPHATKAGEDFQSLDNYNLKREIARCWVRSPGLEAEKFIEPLPDELPATPKDADNVFDTAAANAAAQVEADTFPVLDLDTIIDRPPLTWLVERHLPEQSIGFIYGHAGTFKSFVALDLALSIAAGLPTWQGDPINARPGAAVVYLALEGSHGLRARIRAWLGRRGIDRNAIGDRFQAIEAPIDLMNADQRQKLLRTLRRHAGSALALIVVDTVSRTLPGAKENAQEDMTKFVAACDGIKQAFGCSVLGVHHAGKSGDMRGSTVLRGAGDFVFRFDRKGKAMIGSLVCEKCKDGPDGWSDLYRTDVVQLGEKQSSLVIERVDASLGASIDLSAEVATRVLRAMDDAWRSGQPWSREPRAKERYACRRMTYDFGIPRETSTEALRLWERTGVIRVELASSKTKARGYRVLQIPSDEAGEGDLSEDILSEIEGEDE